MDPGNGTGSYLVEVLRRIATTLKANGGDALVASDLKEAAIKRVFGFEILPASFVVAHLQLGLLLQSFGAPLDDDSQERVGVYLTNALTGWEPLDPEKEKAFQAMLASFPELLGEWASAGEVKRDKPILVILGNPPYNAFAGVSPAEEAGLVDVYKEKLNTPVERGGWGVMKFNLDDLYTRFFRLAERRIAEHTGKGVVCYISNFSYLGGESFVVMRQRFLNEFDKLWFDCMNGDSRETGKLTPEGKPDPSVFSTEYNREGIRVGTAIGLLVRKTDRFDNPTVHFRHFWGVNKRSDLLASVEAKDFDGQYELVAPDRSNRFSFRPLSMTSQYLTWPDLTHISAISPFNGPVERRGLALISIDREALTSRMQSYFDGATSDEEIKRIYPSLMMTGNRIIGPEARRKIIQAFNYDPSRIVRYPFKPFDFRWCYLENLRPLFSEPSPRLLGQRTVSGNAFLVSRDAADKIVEGPPFFFSSLVCDYDSISGHARHFPMHLRATLLTEGSPSANLSPAARSYLAQLAITSPDTDAEAAWLVWMHALAIGYSPAYLSENADGIRQDWPRVPLPATKQALEASARLGHQVAALLDTENPVPGVTAGSIRQELAPMSTISREGGGQLQGNDLAVTVGWGHSGQNSVVMPGKGKLVERDYSLEELASLQAGAEQLGLSLEDALGQLGDHTCDVYLNDVAYWCNVPIGVWEYVIGGYQVIKKWLSYRESPLLGRPLTSTEVREVQAMARRIAAILLLLPALDENYQAVKAASYAWPPGN